MTSRLLVVLGSHTAKEIYEVACAMHSDQYESIEHYWYEEVDFNTRFAPHANERFQSVDYVAGVADVQWKQRIVQACEAVGWQAKTIVHATAVISPSAKLGGGVFVGPQAVVSTNAVIGNHCLVHLHSSIGHDAQVGDLSVVLPGARISGNVKLGARVLIGSNAFVNAGVSVGDDCQVDALTYVVRDLQPGYIQSSRHPKPIPRVMG